MGIENLIEEGIGAFAAEKGLTAVDPDAGFLTKAAAAFAGGEGVNLLKGALGGGQAQSEGKDTDNDQTFDSDASQDDSDQ